MSRPIPDRPLLPPVGSLRRYLRAHGWTVGKLSNGRTDLFVLPPAEDGQAVELFVPKSSAVDGAERYVALAIETLSALEDCKPADMSRQIYGVGYDRLFTFLPDTFHQSVPLVRVENVIRAERRLLTLAAAAEIARHPAGANLTAAAHGYAARCRFGHTFHGSFGLTIESPVGPHDDCTLDETAHPPPPERMFMQRVARGVRAAKAAGDASDPGIVVRNLEGGFDASMCDELIRVYESADADRLRFAFEFSPEWKAPEDLTRLDVEIGARSVAVLKEASSELRGRREPAMVTIRGPVQLLAATGNPADLEHPTGSRDIAVMWDGDLGLLRVSIRLDPATYQRAGVAHLSGSHVAVSGLLQKSGAIWRLRDPTGFEVLG